MSLDFIKNKLINKVHLTGIITQNPIEFIEQLPLGDTRKCLETKIAVQRRSGFLDEIVIVLKNNEHNLNAIQKGTIVKIQGHKSSRNENIDGKSKLKIYVSVSNIEVKDKEYLDIENKRNPNYIELEGFICKPPIFRSTPQGRVITDALIAVNRPYPSTKTDYIPLIGWGSVAEKISKLEVGSKISLKGRIQSRNYEKKIIKDGNEVIENKVAYEVSINEFEVLNN